MTRLIILEKYNERKFGFTGRPDQMKGMGVITTKQKRKKKKNAGRKQRRANIVTRCIFFSEGQSKQRKTPSPRSRLSLGDLTLYLGLGTSHTDL